MSWGHRMEKKLLYRKIYDNLKMAVNEGVLLPGDRIPTVEELRAKYGVSHITVLRALKELQSDRIIEASGKRYAVAGTRNVHTLKNMSCIGVLTRTLWPYSLRDNYFNDINYGIDDECAVCNLSEIRLPKCRMLNAFPIVPKSSLDEIVSSVEQMPDVDGFIFDERLPDEEISRILAMRQVPAVVVNRTTALDIPAVVPDGAGAVKLLVETGRRLGCKGFIFCRDTANSPIGIERLQAFLRMDIPENQRRIVSNTSIVTIDLALREFFQAFEELKDLGKIMIIAHGDAYARSLLGTLGNKLELHGVPFCIAGINNLGSAVNFSPRLCSVDVGTVEMGRLAVRALCSGHCNKVLSPEIKLEMGETLC